MERIQLGNTVFEGQNSSYLFNGSETVLVDTGIATPDTREELIEGLATHGVSFADVDIVFLTHYHGDHAGLAGEIQHASDATVYAHPEDAPLIAKDPDAWEALYDRQRQLFDEWRMPADKREALVNHIKRGRDNYGDAVETTTFEDGDTFNIGETTLEVMHTPGHTCGLSSFVMTDRNEILSGDALLPVYTPNVGGADVRVKRPLEKYLKTLQRIADEEFDRAWPGHRDPIDDPTDRAVFIMDHHEERAYKVLRVLADRGPSDAWTVSAELFGDLVRIHILHGPGEAYAHLEHLERAGDITRDGSEYELTDDTRDRLEARSDERWPLSA